MTVPIPFVKKEEFEGKVLNSNKPVMVWFTVPGCVPCRKIEPRIVPLYYSNKKYMEFFRLDIEKNPEIAQEYEIRNTPVLIFFINGEEKERMDWMPSLEEIQEKIKKLAAKKGGEMYGN